MRKKLIFTVILSTLLFLQSCEKRGIIPKDVMSQIYYDMYMNDQAVKSRYIFRRMSDTLHIYAPVFEKYGYTEEDYRRSMEYYLMEPEKLEKIFKKTLSNLEKRKSILDAMIAAEEKRTLKWDFIDSLEYFTADTIQSSGYYRALRMLFFKPDSIVPNSPVPDSGFMDRPTNIYTIFNDSILNSDKHFRFHTTLGIFPALPKADTLQLSDSLSSSVDSIKVEKIESDKKERVVERPQKEPQRKFIEEPVLDKKVKTTINPKESKSEEKSSLPILKPRNPKNSEQNKRVPNDTTVTKRKARSNPKSTYTTKNKSDSTAIPKPLRNRNKKN